MKPSSFALGIPHCPWKPERVASLERLMSDLGGPFDCCRIFDERENNAAWSEKLWTWASETRATHLLQLQDDARVAPCFWPALRAMVASVPDQIIGLETVAAAAPRLATEGHRWITTSDGLVGVGYVVPIPILREFLAWRRTALKPGTLDGEHPRITEDQLLGIFALATGRRIYHPIPTILDHDTSIPSTYGNDAHGARKPLVTWESPLWRPAISEPCALLEQSGFWRRTSEESGGTPHAGVFYDSSPSLAYECVEGFTDEDYARARRDDGRALKRRLYHLTRAALADRDVPRIFVATPVREGLHPEYHASVLRLVNDASVECVTPWDLFGSRTWNEDLVVCRSRFVRHFLETDATHLLFLDADVSIEPETVRGMLAAKRDFVAVPYPKRDAIRFDRLAAAPDVNAPEALAYEWSLDVLEGTTAFVPDEGKCVEIGRIGLGCALLSREGLEKMAAYYRSRPFDAKGLASRFMMQYDDAITNAHADAVDLVDPLAALLEATHVEAQRTPSLEYDDDWRGKKAPTVALFECAIERRKRYGEDKAFCNRWRAMGGRVWLYLGPGSPATHHGSHAYAGRLEAFGLKRRAT